jgi:DNA invertase Pin-like site-specific DNA recombinase
MPDLERWANAQELPVEWHEDKVTGTKMDRPAWNKLEHAIRSGKVATVCVWRLDRLGRTASGLTALFDELRERKVNLVSLKDGVDLSTPAGRMMANVLASVAQYETEVRGERVAAGQAAARAAGKRWGGSKPGVRKRVTKEKLNAILKLKSEGTPIARIARAVEVSRQTVYSVLKESIS